MKPIPGKGKSDKFSSSKGERKVNPVNIPRATLHHHRNRVTEDSLSQWHLCLSTCWHEGDPHINRWKSSRKALHWNQQSKGGFHSLAEHENSVEWKTCCKIHQILVVSHIYIRVNVQVTSLHGSLET